MGGGYNSRNYLSEVCVKKFGFGVVGAVALCATVFLGFTGCSNSAGENSSIGGTDTGGTVSDNSEKILDLRIKKNGVLYDPNVSASVPPSVSKSLAETNGISASIAGQVPGDDWNKRLFNEDRYQTSHVKVENVENGFKFTITRPSTKYFAPAQNGRFEWVGITRIENVPGVGDEKWTTRADPNYSEWNSHPDENEFTCLYPLCEPGERYVFWVDLQGAGANTHRGDPDVQLKEYVSIVAKDGIGDIDYRYLDPSRNIELKYEGNKPIVKLSNCIPPKNAMNLKSCVTYYAGTKEWQGDSTLWVGSYSENGPVLELTDNSYGENFAAAVKVKGKTQFFVQHVFSFTVPQAQGINNFNSFEMVSEIVSIE